MGYEVALSKAWSELKQEAKEKNFSLRFLSDTYSVDLENKSISSLSCNVPAKTPYAILILHYLARELKGLPQVEGEWISFKELVGGQGYYPVFQNRVINTIMRKYKAKPEALLALTERFNAKRVQTADISIVLEPFPGVPILITFWRGDEEFSPEMNVLFDKSISTIFCTEDIVVLAEITAHTI